MITINHESYVSAEDAKLLEKAGFNWKEYLKPLSIYDGGGSAWKIPLHIAQKWLREEKGIEVFVEPFVGFYKYMVEELKEDGIYDYDRLGSYEEAQEAGIKKVLELILNKGE